MFEVGEMNMNLKERNANMRDFFNKKIDSYDMVHNNFMNIKSKITDYLKEDTKKGFRFRGWYWIRIDSIF